MRGDWQLKTLVDVVERITVGHVGPMAHEYVTEGIPFLRSQNVTSAGVNTNDLRFISAEFHERLRKSSLEAGDVVVVRTGRPGAAAVVPTDLGPANCSDLVIIRPGEHITPRFLAGFINSVAQQQIAANIVGAVQQHFNVGAARRLELNLPPVKEQRAIASVLGALDDKIESNRRCWQTQHDLLPAFYEASVGQPAEWGTIGDLGTVVGGGTPKSSEPSYWEPAQVAWITPKDMTALGGAPVIGGGVRGISRTGLASSSAKLLPKGSVVYTSRATLGLIAITQRELATNQGFISVVPDPLLGSAFVYCSLSALRDQVHALASGSTFMEVNKTNFRSVACPCPTEEALLGFRESTEALVASIAVLLDESRTLTAIRDALLPKLVSGQIRVPLSDDPEEQVGTAVEALQT